MELRDKVAAALAPCLERAHNEFQLADAAIATVQEARWQDMDDWCKNQAAQITSFSEHYIMDGGDLDAPDYRLRLGRHQAFMQMRSFIHGATKPPPPFEGMKHD